MPLSFLSSCIERDLINAQKYFSFEIPEEWSISVFLSIERNNIASLELARKLNFLPIGEASDEGGIERVFAREFSV
jgi:hypothetical protein